jgi:membrane-bound lytic murein transglycosylase D
LISACAHRPSHDRAARDRAYRERGQLPVSRGGWLPDHELADLLGTEPPPAPTSSTSLDSAFFDHVEGDEPTLIPALKVAPILAVTGTVVTFDIPMAEDERVEEWVTFLTGRGRSWYSKWLGRSTRYVPLFWKILDEHGLPRDLIFLSMIESGFSPSAYSWAHAAGAWQFMPATGREYGLQVGFWLDERRDFELSTHAAAKYLKRLHSYFEGDWYLAWAAYNAGQRKVNRAMARTKSRDFWRLSRSPSLKRETSHYVPKLLAAAKIAKQPDKYGFAEVEYLPPLTWDVLTVTVATDLKTIAKACGLQDQTEIAALNPALRAEVTPPGREYPLRVPAGMKPVCERGLAAIPAAERMTFRYCEVGRKDTLAKIARRYHTTPEAILDYNKIEADRIGDLEELVVPVPLARAELVPIVEPPQKRFRPGKYGPEELSQISVQVRSGDSLWKIARRYRVSLQKLRLWNGLWKNSKLKIGQKLRVYIGQGRGPS